MNKKLVINSLICLLMVLALLPGAKSVQAQPVRALVTPGAKYVPGEVIVLFEHGVPVVKASAQASAMAGAIGAEVVSVDPISPAALLRTSKDADVPALVGQLRQMEGVRTAEPNYIYSVPEVIKPTDRTAKTEIKRIGKDFSSRDVKVETLKAMRTVKSGSIMATYPNDPSLWENWGWDAVGASMVWSNSTTTRNVCVIDTGVDYTHPDLAGQVIKGYDFINGDSNPMDDFGHGTHVAGIIAARMNNKQGIAGVGKGKVVAVKALDSTGSGSSYEITQAIEYCAYRSDINIINMSLGGPGYSSYMEEGVSTAYAKKKLIVASAGNDDTFSYCEVSGVPTGDLRSYPAGFATPGPREVYPNCTDSSATDMHPGYDNVLSVGAVDGSGYKADFSNYGTWVNIAAPGVDIYSTLPWNKPFTLNFLYGYNQNYDYLSGTSMAAPFVSGTAARVWGYVATKKVPPLGGTYQQTIEAMRNSPYQFTGGEYNWPAEQADSYIANVAAGMERGALVASVYDAATGLPLPGAKVSVYAVGPDSPKAKLMSSASTTYTSNPTTDIINLPETAVSNYIYRLLVSKSGYTNGSQDAFVGSQGQDGWVSVFPGYWNGYNWDIFAAVPPNTGNFTAVAEWGEAPIDNIGNIITHNLDLLDYIPPSNPDLPYVVHPNLGYDPTGIDEGTTTGNMTDIPFARYLYGDVGLRNILPFESTAILARPKATALPYYQGTYTLRLTDTNAGSIRLNDDINISAFLWKNGQIKTRVDRGAECDGPSGVLWWTPFTITSASGGSAAISTPTNNCTNTTPIYP